MATRQQILNIAAKEIGPNSTGKKYTGTNVAWCNAFVSWVFKQAGVPSSNMPQGWCTRNTMPAFRAAGRFHRKGDGYTPQPGDVVYFFFGRYSPVDHVGIVEYMQGSTMHTIEGNTTSKSGKGVWRKTRSSWYGVGTPIYDGQSTYTDATTGSGTVNTEITEPPHIPQTTKEWTVYKNDNFHKPLDRYDLVWQSYKLNKTRIITDRIGNVSLRDDSDAICTELSFEVMQSTDEKFVQPLEIEPGDLVSWYNTESGECLFLGQVQSSDGSYRDSMTYTCSDQGRLLNCNDIIIQFDNIPAKDAIAQIGKRLGIQNVSCPNLISSVYGIYKDNCANIIQTILETVTSENGVKYFPRMLGNTLTIRSYAQTPITAWHKQAQNLTTFDVTKEVSAPSISKSIADLRNEVVIYSEQDTSVSIQADIENPESIKRYGRRVGLDTYAADNDKISATQKAKNLLATLDVVSEGFTVTMYGSDAVVAGTRLTLDLQEAKGDFWVQAVEHTYGEPHMMTVTMERVR
jgi:CHAP domain.